MLAGEKILGYRGVTGDGQPVAACIILEVVHTIDTCPAAVSRTSRERSRAEQANIEYN
jgi:hypothetical protein